MSDDSILIQTRPITKSLGVCGWAHLDAVLLAALATESPVLLIGPHGTAKSLLVERVANALRLPLRHYNAALLNYDDLVGIPMPDETGTTLHFITTPGTIWDAGFVFFDEISRCRVDLQNKLFPIVHERRVIGIHLDKLKHRWAAMNPPAPEEPDNSNTNTTYYLGSEPLDPALTDRFPFIALVPNWSELSKEDRRTLVTQGQNGYSADALSNLPEMIEECARLIETLREEIGDWLGDYIVCLMDLLEQAGLSQSPRRAATLVQSVIAIHAARTLLEGEDATLEDSAEIAVIYGLPQNATEVPPTKVKVIALHKQAWEVAEYLEDDTWRQVMEEFDLVRRVALADQLEFSDEDLSRLITQALGAEKSDAQQIGVATAMFLAFSRRRDLDASAFEPLAQLAYHVMSPRPISLSVDNNSPQNTIWNEITNWINMSRRGKDSFLFRLQCNYLLYGLGALWEKYNWKDALEQFNADLLLFGVEEEA